MTASTLAASESDDLHISVAQITKNGSTEVLDRVAVYGSFKLLAAKGIRDKLGAFHVTSFNPGPGGGLTPEKTSRCVSLEGFPYCSRRNCRRVWRHRACSTTADLSLLRRPTRSGYLLG